jgi:hypothetical protein
MCGTGALGYADHGTKVSPMLRECFLTEKLTAAQIQVKG